MSVYVDDVRHGYGRMVMCHMWADSLEELHVMASKIGISRRWFQAPPKASWHHYDVSLGKKALALAAGAIMTDRYGPLEYRARQRGDQKAIKRIAESRKFKLEQRHP